MFSTFYYGQNLYSLDNSKISGDKEPSIDEIEKYYFVYLLPYLPPFLREVKQTIKLFRSQGIELGYNQYFMSDIYKQMFIDTATWGLDYWEFEYGIDTNINLSYKTRREIIKAKMRGSGTTTIQALKNIALAFTGGEIEVIENTQSYSFIIKFISMKGIPSNMHSFTKAIDEVVPAHLSYSFEYTYIVWKDLKIKNWKQLSKITWKGVKNNDGGVIVNGK